MRVRGVIAAASASPVDGVIRKRERQRHRRRARKAHRRHVAVIRGLEHDHFIAPMSERLDRSEDRLRRAGRDGHFMLGVVRVAIETRHLGRDRLAQAHDARHQRILVVPRAHRGVDQIDQRGIDRIIGKSLPEIHRAMLVRERRHDSEDRRAGGRQLGANVERHERDIAAVRGSVRGHRPARPTIEPAPSVAAAARRPRRERRRGVPRAKRKGIGASARRERRQAGRGEIARRSYTGANTLRTQHDNTPQVRKARPRRPRPYRQYAAGRNHPSGHRALPAVRQAGKSESGRLDQGSHRAVDDRRRRAGRAAQAPAAPWSKRLRATPASGSRWSRARRAIACCW